MRWYKADIHIHTVLSPCSGLDMSPVNIIRQAAMKKLDIIGITDHNSTRHCRLAQQIGEKYGITVIAGAEINTREEIHCLTFFENISKADRFQQVIDQYLTVIRNKPEFFGHQYLVDEEENILEEEYRLLVASLQLGINEIADRVHELGGFFIPAHINRLHNGLYSQLGFLPRNLRADALEVAQTAETNNFLTEHPETRDYCLVTSSDVHSLEQIGASVTEWYLEQPDFMEMRQALNCENGRKIRIS
jgi:3',5'-nucleoside bisphosphate phosphatase